MLSTKKNTTSPSKMDEAVAALAKVETNVEPTEFDEQAIDMKRPPSRSGSWADEDDGASQPEIPMGAGFASPLGKKKSPKGDGVDSAMHRPKPGSGRRMTDEPSKDDMLAEMRAMKDKMAKMEAEAKEAKHGKMVLVGADETGKSAMFNKMKGKGGNLFGRVAAGQTAMNTGYGVKSSGPNQSFGRGKGAKGEGNGRGFGGGRGSGMGVPRFRPPQAQQTNSPPFHVAEASVVGALMVSSSLQIPELWDAVKDLPIGDGVLSDRAIPLFLLEASFTDEDGDAIEFKMFDVVKDVLAEAEKKFPTVTEENEYEKFFWITNAIGRYADYALRYPKTDAVKFPGNKAIKSIASKVIIIPNMLFEVVFRGNSYANGIEINGDFEMSDFGIEGEVEFESLVPEWLKEYHDQNFRFRLSPTETRNIFCDRYPWEKTMPFTSPEMASVTTFVPIGSFDECLINTVTSAYRMRSDPLAMLDGYIDALMENCTITLKDLPRMANDGSMTDRYCTQGPRAKSRFYKWLIATPFVARTATKEMIRGMSEIINNVRDFKFESNNLTELVQLQRPTIPVTVFPPNERSSSGYGATEPRGN
jgi:hypothetical protein